MAEALPKYTPDNANNKVKHIAMLTLEMATEGDVSVFHEFAATLQSVVAHTPYTATLRFAVEHPAVIENPDWRKGVFGG